MEELVDLPAGVLSGTFRELVLARFDRLSETAGIVVSAVSAAGMHAEHDLLTKRFPGERARLHRGFAAALETRVAAGHRDRSAEVAEHWMLARDLPRAFEATAVARAYASETSGTVAAEQVGARLLELWSHAGTPAGSRAEVAPETAWMWHEIMQPNRAILVARRPHAVGVGCGQPRAHRLEHSRAAALIGVEEERWRRARLASTR